MLRRMSIFWNTVFGHSSVVSSFVKKHSLSVILISFFLGMMIESMAGKAAAMHGAIYDASPFVFKYFLLVSRLGS